MIIYIVSFFLIFISLFILFSLSRNDFILLRKNIPPSHIFNYAFVAIFTSFISGRVFYILDTRNFFILNPISFFHLFRFPGFQLEGAFVGGALILFLMIKDRVALFRIYDIFFLSFFPFFSLSLFLNPLANLLVFKIALVIASLVLFNVFLDSHKEYIFRDGTLSLIILIILSVNFLITYIFIPKTSLLYIFSFVQLISVIAIIVSLFFIFKNEKIIFKK